MPSKIEIETFIKNYISQILNIPKESIEGDVPVDATYGLESMDVLALGAELEDWLEIELGVDVFFQNRTIDALSSQLFKLVAQE